MVGTLVIAGVMLASTPSSPHSILNERLAHLLDGQDLQVEEIKEGAAIPLHSLIATSPLSGILRGYASGKIGDPHPDGIVTITWRLQEMDRHFVGSLSETSSAVRMFHPFADRGIETVARGNSFSITLHEGMLLHLRDDIPSFPQVKTFASDNPIGIVTEVRGRAYVSKDFKLIQTKLASLWSDSLLCAGSLPRCTLGETCMQAPNGMYVATARKLKGVSCAAICIWGVTCFRKDDGNVEINSVVTAPPA